MASLDPRQPHSEFSDSLVGLPVPESIESA